MTIARSFQPNLTLVTPSKKTDARSMCLQVQRFWTTFNNERQQAGFAVSTCTTTDEHSMPLPAILAGQYCKLDQTKLIGYFQYNIALRKYCAKMKVNIATRKFIIPTRQA